MTVEHDGEKATILVDGGRTKTAAALRSHLQQTGTDRLDIVVVSHVDRDHVTGILELLTDAPPDIADLWFNGYRHLHDGLEGFGPVDGERLTTAITNRGIPWNQAFGGGPVTAGATTSVGPATITVLSPSPHGLAALAPVWRSTCERAGTAPGLPATAEPSPPGWEQFGVSRGDLEDLSRAAYVRDTSVANASSIALLVEAGGATVLCSADSTAEQLRAALTELRTARQVNIDIAQLPHHGSVHNTSRELLETLHCRRLLVSSDAKTTHRPSATTISRAAVSSPRPAEITFNYRAAADRARQILRNEPNVTVFGPIDDAEDGYVTVTT